MSTRKMIILALFTALSVLLIALVHFPLLPAAPWLEFDLGDVPILLASLLYGPLAGLIVTVIASVIQAYTVSAQSGVYGMIMHILASGTMALVAGGLFRVTEKSSWRMIFRLVFSFVTAALALIAVMVPANLLVTPLFIGQSAKEILPLIPAAVVPFNALKGIINAVAVSALYLALYKRILPILHARAQK